MDITQVRNRKANHSCERLREEERHKKRRGKKKEITEKGVRMGLKSISWGSKVWKLSGVDQSYLGGTAYRSRAWTDPS